MRRGLIFILLLAGFVLVPLLLDSAPAVALAEIGIDNHLFLRIRTPAAGFKIEERRVLLDQRLVEILSYENTRNPKVWIGNIRGKPTIYVGETKLITVYPRDAKANNTTSSWLASHWAQRLRAGIPQVAPVRTLKPLASKAASATGEDITRDVPVT